MTGYNDAFRRQQRARLTSHQAQRKHFVTETTVNKIREVLRQEREQERIQAQRKLMQGRPPPRG